MATQTVTVSRPPATGNSQSTAIPPASSPVDYSLTDLDLLEVSDAQEGTAEQSDASTTPPEASSEKGTDHPQPAAESKDAKKSPPSEFDAAFALPEVGPKLREICEREAAYREVFPSADSARTAAAAQAQLAGLDRIVESRDPRAHADLLDGLQRNAPDAFRSLAVTFGERLATLDPEAYRAVSTTMAAHALANQRWPEHVALLSRAVEQQDWPAVKFLAATLTTQIQQWRVPPGGTAGAPPPVPI
ncbi:MAG TPA: hypothetical protein VKG84_06130, partial [Candidatus Acidoferrales bacterium]|nr:hypothetical protein [Candidatus Acidoferrales bacterium]